MTLKERMFYLIEKEGLNPNQFYTISGLGNGYLNNVGESFRKPTIEKIKKSFPHWNMDWILYEKGEPISNISKENIEIRSHSIKPKLYYKRTISKSIRTSRLFMRISRCCIYSYTTYYTFYNRP